MYICTSTGANLAEANPGASLAQANPGASLAQADWRKPRATPKVCNSFCAI